MEPIHPISHEPATNVEPLQRVLLTPLERERERERREQARKRRRPQGDGPAAPPSGGGGLDLRA